MAERRALLMSGVRMLVVVAPLRLTVWILAVAAAAIVVLIAIGMSRHLETVRAARSREHVRAELGPVFSRFSRASTPRALPRSFAPRSCAWMRRIVPWLLCS
jgi:hypothetical protein